VKKQLGNKIQFAESMYDTLNDADALVISTEWSIFRTPDFYKMKTLMKGKVIFDGRNLYDVKDIENEDFKYISIGR